MNNSITISVIMAVYNTSFSLVNRAINSVLNQDYKNFELIIVDDGSDNNSSNDIVNFTKQHDDKIIYLRHKNCGQSISINRGILNSSGKYISIIDADDEYMPNHLTSCINEMHNADLIASTTNTIVNTDEDYYVPDKYDFNKIIHVDDCILFATLFGKKEVFENYAFENIYAADAHFYEKVSEKYTVKKVDLRTYIYYRNNASSICSVLKKSNTLQLR